MLGSHDRIWSVGENSHNCNFDRRLFDEQRLALILSISVGAGAAISTGDLQTFFHVFTFLEAFWSASHVVSRLSILHKYYKADEITFPPS